MKSESSIDNSPSLINLNQSLNAKSFTNDNIVHKKEYIKAVNWIDERISYLDNYSYDATINECYEIRNDVISVLGGRGSGKTSFLLSLINNYRKRADVEVLSIIDPTMIEEKGHIFLTLLSIIVDTVDKVLDKSNIDPLSSIYQKKSDWREKLKVLAAGLPSLNNDDCKYDKWQDPEFVMDKGLMSVRAAKKLSSDFETFVRESLYILNKKAFIIVFDDIDIDFRKGWMVLETLRKYLITPYVIPIVSGDLALFSKSIRKQQWKNFGKALVKNEGEKLNKMQEYNNLVDEMESQYMQKVLKPKWRIHLPTLLEMDTVSEIVKVKDIENDYASVRDYYVHFLRKKGINNKYQMTSFIPFLMSLPLRTQIQLMLALPDKNLFGMLEPFTSELSEKGVNIDLLKSSPWLINTITLSLLSKGQLLNDSYQLQPNLLDSSYNACLFSLTIVFSSSVVQYPYLIFDYLVRIGYLHNLLSLLPDRESIMSIDYLIKYAKLFQDVPLRDISCDINSYVRAALNYQYERSTDRSWGGNIVLLGFASKAKEGRKEMLNRIDRVFEGKNLSVKSAAFLPLTILQPSNKQNEVVNYSIYTLLASIGELIRMQMDSTESMVNGLAQLSQIRSYSFPSFDRTGRMRRSVDIETHSYPYRDMDQGEMDDLLAVKITKWIDARLSEGNITFLSIPPYLLGKISTRFFSSMINIERGDVSLNLGEAMHRRVIIFMNAVLFECTREYLPNIKLNNNNPSERDKIFLDNLKSVNDSLQSEELDELPIHFMRWILSCPLLIAYLNLDYMLLNNLKTFLNKDVSYFDFSIYEDLVKIDLKDSYRNVKISFSAAQENWPNTLSVIRKFYPMPRDFINDEEKAIRIILKDYFISISKTTIQKIKNQFSNRLNEWSSII